MKKRIVVTASEIGEYVYCPRAWWLRWTKQLYTTPAMWEGTARHEELSDHLQWQDTVMLIVTVVMGIAVLLVLFSGIQLLFSAIG